jgi:hypothetical protein
MILAAYANRNGVFMVYRRASNGKYYLRKYTFGKESHAEVRITAAIFEKLEKCSSFSDSWDMAHNVLKSKLEIHNANKTKEHKGNF